MLRLFSWAVFAFSYFVSFHLFCFVFSNVLKNTDKIYELTIFKIHSTVWSLILITKGCNVTKDPRSSRFRVSTFDRCGFTTMAEAHTSSPIKVLHKVYNEPKPTTDVDLARIKCQTHKAPGCKVYATSTRTLEDRELEHMRVRHDTHQIGCTKTSKQHIQYKPNDTTWQRCSENVPTPLEPWLTDDGFSMPNG
jgi:hypothetical protein